ncbi:MAG: phosphomannomutase/phosphoglucomutase [Bacteroidales bacterium]|nr:phosphomannomutase/phosphoglucomutase [Bacteroidales bacterium]
MKVFKAYDIRGVYGVDFTSEDAYKIGFFLPQVMKADKILVGRDVRLSSPEIYEQLTKGITDSGADVCNLGLSTTPMVYWATAKFGFEASVMITASHNPASHNGLKVSGKNAAPIGYESGLKTVEELVENAPITPSANKGRIKDIDIKEQYLDFMRQYLPDISNLKVGIDCSNGMAALLIKELLGDKPLYICDTLDGSFPNHEGNPLIAENRIALQKLVLENKCDVGVIYDGDADRVMFVDENGEFISPDLMIAALCQYFLKEKGLKGKVYQDIRTSKSVGEYVESLGSEMVMWRVGRAYAASKLREVDGIFGGELAGHYYFRDFYYSDSGILASLILLGIIAKNKQNGIPVSKLISSIRHYENSGEINFKIEEKKKAMDSIVRHFTSAETPTAFYDFDGYRIEYKDWWLNIRPSNTEPLLRFLCEANTTQLLEKIKKQVIEIVKDCGGELE